MNITRTSIISGKTRTIDLPVDHNQIMAWEDGMLIQRAMPNLTPAQREFIMTGITEDEWNENFPVDPD